MFFVVRDGRYVRATQLTFRDFLERGFDGHRATLADWNLHLTTLFPEVRLKGVIEVRGSDAVPPELICALPALWKGVLYDAQACEAAWKLVERWTPRQREELLAEVARRGLASAVAGRPMLEVAREFTAIAADGLRRIAERGDSESDERSFLDPLHEQLERGASPGEVVLEAWREEWRGDARRLIEHARYSERDPYGLRDDAEGQAQRDRSYERDRAGQAPACERVDPLRESTAIRCPRIRSAGSTPSYPREATWAPAPSRSPSSSTRRMRSTSASAFARRRGRPRVRIATRSWRQPVRWWRP
jgi:hypothetical protein